MAKVVMGLGTAHSPMLSTPPDIYPLHAERDMGNPELLWKDGKFYSYAELLEKTPANMQELISMDRWNERHEASQRAIDRVGDLLREANPDVVVIVGDDQEEFFFEDNRPSISIFHGDKLINHAHDFSTLPPSFQAAAWGWYSETEESYECHPELATHIVKSLIAEDFDVSTMKMQPEKYSVGHAFSFVERRIMKDHRIPIVPVMLNTFYPPNQPNAKRCFNLGQGIRRAIESWDSNQKVLVMASGGLSHFVVLEELDRMVIDAFEAKDWSRVTSIPETMFQSGTSEIKNWITVAGALQDRSFELIEYVAGYRSPAGTGGGWTWAQWK